METLLLHPSSPKPSRIDATAFRSVEFSGHRLQLLHDGATCIAALVDLIRRAQQSICLEMYIFRDDETGARIRDELSAACERGVRVRILLDDFGSNELPHDYFIEVIKLGAQVRTFNPARFLRVAFRNHRKLCVADRHDAIVGGFNVGNEYNGDGVTSGWRDLGLRVSGPIAVELEGSFDRMFLGARVDRKALAAVLRSMRHQVTKLSEPALLTSGPAFGGASMHKILHADLERAKQVDIMTAYFAPTWVLQRRLLLASARGKVRLILPGQSDVPVLRLAGQHLYTRLLRGGTRIYEYQPQILHGKLLVIDNTVYIGSCNLDTRSLRINFELLLRIPSEELAAQARRMLEADVEHSEAIELKAWRANSRWWQKVVRQFACWLAVRFDMFLVRRKWRAMR